MPPKRPVAVVVVAVLQLVFAALGLCNAAVELSGLAEQLAAASLVCTTPKMTQLDVLNYWREHLPGERVLEQASAVLGLVLCLTMVASAVGLLRLRPWGWYLALAYALLSILATAAEAAYNFGARAPAVAELSRGVGAAGGADAQLAGQMLQVIFLATFVLSALAFLYPVVVLAVLCRRRVRAAFGAGTVPEEQPADYRDPVPSAEDQGPDNHFQAGPR